MEINKQSETRAIMALAQGKKYGYQIRYNVIGETIADANIGVSSTEMQGVYYGNVALQGDNISYNISRQLPAAERMEIMGEVEEIINQISTEL